MSLADKSDENGLADWGGCNAISSLLLKAEYALLSFLGHQWQLVIQGLTCVCAYVCVCACV